MEWAERVGLGELGLSREQFWTLTVPEFHLKHEAFMRAEHRTRSLVIEHALMTGHVAENRITEVKRSINALRQYPVKPWLLEEQPEE